MFINRVANQLLAAPELEEVLRQLRAGEDSTLAIAQSARPLVLASLWADDPRPCLLVVSGEEAADRTARALAAWLGMEHVARFPERRDWPWSDKPADDAVVGARCAAIARLAAGENCVVVASARALLRRAFEYCAVASNLLERFPIEKPHKPRLCKWFHHMSSLSASPSLANTRVLSHIPVSNMQFQTSADIQNNLAQYVPIVKPIFLTYTFLTPRPKVPQELSHLTSPSYALFQSDLVPYSVPI